MSRFSYKAVNAEGQPITGIIESVDRKNAVVNLTGKGQFVTELAEQTETDFAVENVSKVILQLGRLPGIGSGRITGKDILSVTGQLSAALRAGLPLLNALEIIYDQQHKKAMKELFGEIANSVSSGQSLSDAMAKHKKIFSPLYISMIRVGETGGILEKTISQLTTILARDEKIRSNMKNASAYPVFVLGVGLISVAVIITSVLPKILATISGGFEVMPLPTKILLVLSDLLRSWGIPLLGVVAVTLYFFGKWTKTSGRKNWDSFKLKIPILGSVLRTIAVGRFARTLGALTKGGVTILEALSVVRDTLGNELLATEIDKAAEKVKTGTPLAKPLETSGHFPPLLVQIVSIGEQTGKLDELLLEAGETFDEEADAAITKFMAVFPAILILILALIIGFIIAATLLPIVMMELGGGVL